MIVLGYLNRFSFLAGEYIECMIGAEQGPVLVDVVRLRHGDPNPAGPGFRTEKVNAVAAQDLPVGLQRTFVGSCMLADTVVPPGTEAIEITLYAWPTRPAAGTVQGLVSLVDDDGRPVASIALDAQGHLHVRTTPGEVAGRLPGRLLERRWYRITALLGAGGSTLSGSPLQPIPGDADTARVHDGRPIALTTARGVIVAALAAPREGTRPHPDSVFNGKLERPRLATSGTVLAEWAFEREMGSKRTIDVSGHARHGVLVNMPARAMCGHNWTGDVVDFRLDPGQYGAIHFHDDDLSDADWDVSTRVWLPESLRSGTYAVRLRAGGETDHVPFIIRPHVGRPTARVAYLLPSFTYTAYGNLQPRPEHDQTRLHPLDLVLRERPDLGKSLYDSHSDGSGVCYASLARPVLQLRPDYRSWLNGAARHFGADLYLVDWLEHAGVQYDVVCDHDLHDQGQQLLAGYQVVLTGSHPEYCSRMMLDALEAHVAGGGCLMYLGGNGFYWVTTKDDEHPHAIEVRRYVGTRTWDGDPGEQNHSMTGEVGGLWRSRGRPPHALAGIGMTAQGWTGAVGYRRTAQSYDPRWAWVFEGVQADVIGDFGLVMGGASGDELDRAEPRWGTPPQTVVLATSLPHSPGYYAVIEEALAIQGDLSAITSPHVQSDMALVERVGGGAVFSVGSIAFTGSLSWNGYDNDIARVVGNVLAQFLARGGAHE